jgi:hypothetical protein
MLGVTFEDKPHVALKEKKVKARKEKKKEKKVGLVRKEDGRSLSS